MGGRGVGAVYLDLGLLEAGEGGHGHLQVRGQPVQVPGVQLLQGQCRREELVLATLPKSLGTPCLAQSSICTMLSPLSYGPISRPSLSCLTHDMVKSWR